MSNLGLIATQLWSCYGRASAAPLMARLLSLRLPLNLVQLHRLNPKVKTSRKNRLKIGALALLRFGSPRLLHYWLALFSRCVAFRAKRSESQGLNLLCITRKIDFGIL